MKLYQCAIFSSVLLTTGSAATMPDSLYKENSLEGFDYDRRYDRATKEKTIVTNENVIERVQYQLKEKGYAIDTVDGIYGPRTRDNIKEFQRKTGLYPTGTISAETLEALGLKYQTTQDQGEDLYSE